MDKAAREKARELCERLPDGPWEILNYVEADSYPNYHQAITISKVVHENDRPVDEHSVRELAVAARTLLPQALDALAAADANIRHLVLSGDEAREEERERLTAIALYDSDNARLRARVIELEAALRTAIKVAGEAQREWDAAPNGMKAGKLLIALSDSSLKYRADITAMHKALPAPPVGDR